MSLFITKHFVVRWKLFFLMSFLYENCLVSAYFGHQPELKSTIYDQFGRKSTIICEGSSVEVRCTVNDATCTTITPTAMLIWQNKLNITSSVKPDECKQKIDSATWAFTFNINTKTLGTYYCLYKDQISQKKLLIASFNKMCDNSPSSSTNNPSILSTNIVTENNQPMHDEKTRNAKLAGAVISVSCVVLLVSAIVGIAYWFKTKRNSQNHAGAAAIRRSGECDVSVIQVGEVAITYAAPSTVATAPSKEGSSTDQGASSVEQQDRQRIVSGSSPESAGTEFDEPWDSNFVGDLETFMETMFPKLSNVDCHTPYDKIYAKFISSRKGKEN